MRAFVGSGFREILGLLDQSVTVVLRRAVWDVLGAVFIALWWLYFKAKLLLNRWFRWVFIVLTGADVLLFLTEAVEVADARLDHTRIVPGSPTYLVDGRYHALARNLDLGPAALIVVTIMTFGVAFFMFWHHHRVSERVRHHVDLLSRLRHITVEAARLVVSAANPQSAEDFITNALKVLTESTTRFKGSTVRRDATILKKEPASEFFEVYQQWQANYPKVTGLTEHSAVLAVLCRG